MIITDFYVFFYTFRDVFSQHSPHGFTYEGLHFKTAEHWMMFNKARIFILGESATIKDAALYMRQHDENQARIGNTGFKKQDTIFHRILAANHPQKAKMIGRDVKPYTDEVWFRHREEIIFWGNVLKFRQNKDARRVMLDVRGRKFVEASSNDRIYGIGLGLDDERIHDPKNWQGQNLLGKTLDRVCPQICQEFHMEIAA